MIKKIFIKNYNYKGGGKKNYKLSKNGVEYFVIGGFYVILRCRLYPVISSAIMGTH